MSVSRGGSAAVAAPRSAGHTVLTAQGKEQEAALKQSLIKLALRHAVYHVHLARSLGQHKF